MAKHDSEFPPLIQAVIWGDLATVQALIQSKVKLDTRSSEHLTALYYAVEKGHVEKALALIAAGANVNAKDRRGRTILMEAIKRKNDLIVDALLAAGADIHATTRSGVCRNALVVAAAYGRVEYIPKLVALGADVRENNSDCLVNAISSNHPEVVALLLQLGADPSQFRNSQGRTLLMECAFFGEEQLVRVLLEAGADVNARNNSGLTALDIAIEEEHHGVAAILREASET